MLFARFSSLSAGPAYRQRRGVDRRASSMTAEAAAESARIRQRRSWDRKVRSNQAGSNRRAARWRIAFAAVGGCAFVAMAAFGLANGESAGPKNFSGAGPMQTGVTTSESTAAASTAAATLATSQASPTVKATPAWGQPAEP